jgi:hypothetical protein
MLKAGSTPFNPRGDSDALKVSLLPDLHFRASAFVFVGDEYVVEVSYRAGVWPLLRFPRSHVYSNDSSPATPSLPISYPRSRPAEVFRSERRRN